MLKEETAWNSIRRNWCADFTPAFGYRTVLRRRGFAVKPRFNLLAEGFLSRAKIPSVASIPWIPGKLSPEEVNRQMKLDLQSSALKRIGMHFSFGRADKRKNSISSFLGSFSILVLLFRIINSLSDDRSKILDKDSIRGEKELSFSTSTKNLSRSNYFPR